MSLASAYAVPHSQNDSMAHIKGVIVQQAQRIKNDIMTGRAANQPQAPAQAQPAPNAQVQPAPNVQAPAQAQPALNAQTPAVQAPVIAQAPQAIQAVQAPVQMPIVQAPVSLVQNTSPPGSTRPQPPLSSSSGLAPQATPSSAKGKAQVNLCDDEDDDDEEFLIMKERRVVAFRKAAKEDLPKMEFKSKRSLEESKVLIKVAREIHVLRSLLGEGLTSSDGVETRLEEVEEEIKGRLFLLRTADQDGWGVAKHLQEEGGFFADEKYKKRAKEAKKLAQLDKAARPTGNYMRAGNGKAMATASTRYQSYTAPPALAAPAKVVRYF